MMTNKDKIIKKWGSVVNNIGIQNQKLVEIFCLYAENHVIKYPYSEDLPEKINNLIWKLKSTEKLEVVCTRYNPLTGKLEYELENGIIVDEDNKFNKELSQEELVSIFGVDFIREVNKEEFREKRLNNIING